MCLVLRCEPRRQPEYPDDLDFREALQRRGLSDLFTSITQVPHSHDWVVKLRPFATTAKEDLVNDGVITVKGVHCTVFETNARKTKVVVHRVPFHVSDMFVWSELQKYGVVTNVVCHKTDKDDSDYANTIRDAYMYPKKGLSLSDLPYVLRHDTQIEFPVYIRKRPPLCFKCYNIAMSRRAMEVPVEPGDAQVAPAAEGDGKERNVSHQELAPVAEEAAANEPHEVTPHQETGNASSGDLNDSSEHGEAPPSN
ncbi:hypothetical protein MRX96_017085 [Rhipicephalus microplus]